MPRAAQSSLSSTVSSRPKSRERAAAVSARCWGVATLGGAATSSRASSTPAQLADTAARAGAALAATPIRLIVSGRLRGSGSPLKRWSLNRARRLASAMAWAAAPAAKASIGMARARWLAPAAAAAWLAAAQARRRPARLKSAGAPRPTRIRVWGLASRRSRLRHWPGLALKRLCSRRLVSDCPRAALSCSSWGWSGRSSAPANRPTARQSPSKWPRAAGRTSGMQRKSMERPRLGAIVASSASPTHLGGIGLKRRGPAAAGFLVEGRQPALNQGLLQGAARPDGGGHI